MGSAADGAWLERTYHELKHDLFTVALHLTGERHAAEDVVHDVFVALARRGGERGIEHGVAWAVELPTHEDARRYLVKACIHRARDLGRRRATAHVTADGDGALARVSAPDGDPLPRLLGDDEATRVRSALRELPAEQREVVTLHLHGGLKFREIAETLAIPLDTATSRYRYALQKLRMRLGAEPVKQQVRKQVRE